MRSSLSRVAACGDSGHGGNSQLRQPWPCRARPPGRAADLAAGVACPVVLRRKPSGVRPAIDRGHLRERRQARGLDCGARTPPPHALLATEGCRGRSDQVAVVGAAEEKLHKHLWRGRHVQLRERHASSKGENDKLYPGRERRVQRHGPATRARKPRGRAGGSAHLGGPREHGERKALLALDLRCHDPVTCHALPCAPSSPGNPKRTVSPESMGRMRW